MALVDSVVVLGRQELADVIRQVLDERDTASQTDFDPWLDAKAAGTHLGMSPKAVSTAWTRNELPHVLTPRGQRRVRRSTLDAWVLGLST